MDKEQIIKSEILFRGKRLDNGEWAYGGLLTLEGDEDNEKIAYVGFLYRDDKDDIYQRVIQVDSSTVGQYTGLKDYNGNKIFDGDILKVSHLHLPDLVAVKSQPGAFFMYDENGTIDAIEPYDTDAFDVIGNVYDNPDLIKG